MSGKPKPPYKGKWKKTEVATCVQYCLVRIKKLLPTMQRKIDATKTEVANLMKQGKNEIARAKVEGLINERHQYEGYQIIEIYAEQMKTRLNYLDSEQVCPENMAESVGGLVYAQRFADIEYLEALKKHLKSKYGPEKITEWEQGLGGITPRFITKWDNSIPPEDLVTKELSGICKQFGIPFETTESLGNQWGTVDPSPQQNSDISRLLTDPTVPQDSPQGYPPQHIQGSPVGQPSPYQQNPSPYQANPPLQQQYPNQYGQMGGVDIGYPQQQYIQSQPPVAPQFQQYPGMQSVAQLPAHFQMGQPGMMQSVYNPMQATMAGQQMPPQFAFAPPPPSQSLIANDPTQPFDYQPTYMPNDPTYSLPPPFPPPDD
ncbi:putative Regulator of Vps4 activity in the MVB pathway [Blattamonas nauphoetae]|uniref:Regulator of Vps4 activity in the MVB pathway n=1 Tax=Blattamonas nauphoetae TaxID=2049346 RepID=A0ABQ9YGE5_9EUKA|nr:putative Regulator of Vps4 activity in the MVB pathway [Blattamonas nauphoetae]